MSADGNPHYSRPAWELPAYTILLGDGDEPVDRLLELRRRYAQRREGVLQLQKQYAATLPRGKPTEHQREGLARYKDRAAELMRMQRACALFLGHLAAEPPGDSPRRPLAQWGRELAPECRRVDWGADTAQGYAVLMAETDDELA